MRKKEKGRRERRSKMERGLRKRRREVWQMRDGKWGGSEKEKKRK